MSSVTIGNWEMDKDKFHKLKPRIQNGYSDEVERAGKNPDIKVKKGYVVLDPTKKGKIKAELGVKFLDMLVEMGEIEEDFGRD
eukprot:CAMPEP_0197437846 /NCGR_PEP_ID=MMETSP1175-20131217/4992_1 /TAXON_ID=1003142 /ORGANISM="Triceratium dubium, Strain CCMP147" /LENGTH=82 /DNA_ID=CAMNT_0042967465 /DNA_START=214 /DNA_END=462 /DNA_ORIENTATION=-